MRFSITAAKLTGIPEDSGWAQVHEFTPAAPEKLVNRGRLIAVVATKRQETGIDAVSAGRELIRRLHEEYFGREEGSPFDSLKVAVRKVIEESEASWGKIEIVAAALVGEVVYAAVGGGGRVVIFRDGIMANILEGKEEVTCASGYPKEKDVLLLGTTAFFENLPAGVIKAGLSTGNPEEASEVFTPIIHARKGTGSVGAAILRFQKQEETLSRPQSPSFVRNLRSAFEKLAKTLPEPKIYVRSPFLKEEALSGGRKTMLSVGVILLTLLLVSIGFGIRAKRAKEEKARYGGRLQEAQHNFAEAEGLFSLNPARSRELFIDSREILKGLLGEKISDKEISDLAKKIEEGEAKILGEYRQDPEIFIDLSLLSQGFSGDSLSASNEVVYVLDKKGKTVVSVAIATKRSEVVGGPDEVGEALFPAVYEDRVFLLTDMGIFEVDDKGKKVIDKDWSGEAFLSAYAGNLYLLEKGGRTIWRYQGTKGVFGSKQKWLGPGVSPDFSNAVSWAIDGSIWVLGANGRILKFTSGKKDSFGVAGVTPGLENATAIYTNESLKDVYLLEAKKNRVVVLDKNGEFKAQYLSAKIEGATGLVVSESEKRLILLLGDKLYSIELKHL